MHETTLTESIEAIRDLLHAMWIIVLGPVGLVVWKIWEKWSSARTEKNLAKSGDSEQNKKETTRRIVIELAETMSKVVVLLNESTRHLEAMAQDNRQCAEIHRQTFKELEEFRREADRAHMRIESALNHRS